MKTQKKHFILELSLLAFLVLGILTSFKLFTIDIELWGSYRETPSFCNVGGLINCDAVSMSSYSTLLGVSNSLIGILYYSLLTAMALLSFLSIGLRPFFKRFIYISSVISVLVNIILAYVSLMEIKAICLLCWFTYLLNGGILAISWFVLRENPFLVFKNFFVDCLNVAKGFWKRGEFSKSLKISLAIIMLGVLSYAGFEALNSYFQKKTMFRSLNPKEVIAYFENLPKYEVKISETTAPWGSDKPKVTVVEFSDFRCPFCRKGAFLVKNLLKQYSDRVRLIFKNYPIDSNCNKMVGRTLHPMACLLSKASICADRHGKFWRFHDLLFENSKDFSRGDLLETAEREGLNRVEFDRCLDSKETQDVIDAEIEDAKRFKINATPSFLINGRLIIGLPVPRMLTIIVEHELRK